MPDQDYWKERFETLNESLLKDGMDYYDEAEKIFRRAQRSIDRDIAVWYQRFADNNKISLQDAQKLLRKDELEEFKWTVEDYIKHGRENGVSADWSKQLENASARFHISRLEALKIEMQHHLEELYGNYLDGLDGAMRRTYQDSYYKTCYTMQEGFHTGFEVASLPESAVDAVIKKPWAADGMNFSDRIWRDKDKLLRTLQDELTQGLIRGDPQDAIVRRFAKRMGVSLSNAGRLIATESAFFAAKGSLDNLKDLGVEKYQFVATLDRRTSDICRSMDMKIIPVKDFQPGVTAPPLHCWCRSCTVPYMGDNVEGLRAARDEEGKTTYIPDMPYKDWKEIYVDKKMTIEEWEKAHTKKPEAPQAVEKPAFVPAKTIEEAQEYAAQFIDSFNGRVSPFKGVANYKGISLEMANAVNKALTDVFETLNIPKIGGIKVVSSTSAQGKKAFNDQPNAIASYSHIGEGIFLNKNILKDTKTFEKFEKENKKAWNTVMSNIDTLHGVAREMAERYRKAGRDLVSGDTVQGLVTHELGHHVQWRALKAKDSNELTARRSQYADKISGYATASPGEYIAESFAAYMKGERNILDPKFVKAIDGLLKKPRRNDIIKETGALNDKNDPWEIRRNAHAKRYYEFVRKSKKENWVARISKNSGMRKESVRKIYEHVFIKEHKLLEGIKRFMPDYDMAQSFQRLFDGKEIFEHDLIMLKHERLECELMERYGYDFAKAHEITERKYNYSKALKEWRENRVDT